VAISYTSGVEPPSPRWRKLVAENAEAAAGRRQLYGMLTCGVVAYWTPLWLER